MGEKMKITMSMDKTDWERFKKIAKLNDSDASEEVRKFIKKYLSENAQLDLK